MPKKYEITPIAHPDFPELRRIRALIDIPNAGIQEGDLGGYVQGERNLSHDGSCFIHDQSSVHHHSMVYGNAQVRNRARVMESSLVYDRAEISGYSMITGNVRVQDDAVVTEDAKVRGNCTLKGHALIRGTALIKGVIEISDRAMIQGSATVSHQAVVSGDAVVEGNARVTDWATVFDKAQVSERAVLSDSVNVYGEAKVSGEAIIQNRARVYGQARVEGKAVVGGGARVSGKAFIMGNSQVLGSSEMYGDAQISGTTILEGASKISGQARMYEGTVDGNVVIMRSPPATIDVSLLHTGFVLLIDGLAQWEEKFFTSAAAKSLREIPYEILWFHNALLHADALSVTYSDQCAVVSIYEGWENRFYDRIGIPRSRFEEYGKGLTSIPISDIKAAWEYSPAFRAHSESVCETKILTSP